MNPSLRRPSMKNFCDWRPLRSRLLAGACALLALAGTAAPALAQSAPSAQPAPPAWVVKSDKNTQLVLDLLARQSPEGAADLGISGLDEEIFDLTPGFEKRAEEATRKVLAQLEKRLPAETDPPVRQDLQILIDSLKADLKGSELSRNYQIPYFNLTQTLFGSMRSLLDDQVEAIRRPAALVRLKKYTGTAPGYTPLAI